jgi:hypothetical protein
VEAIRSGFRLPCDQDELISPASGSGSTFSGSTTCWTGADLARRRDLECVRRRFRRSVPGYGRGE